MKISVVFPAYNEQENLENLHKRVAAVADSLSKYSFEFIFVDDASKDRTPIVIQQLHQKDARVKTIRFSRNCGSHAALSAGLSHCRGDCAIVLAADLQDPPELIPLFIDHWQQGNKLVWGVREARLGEKKSTKFFSKLYYKLLNWMTNVKLPPSGADIFLADRAVIDAFKTVTEKHTSVFMTLAWIGFQQSEFYYVKEARVAGKTKWSLSKKIKLMLDSVLAFSDIPIRYMSILGFLVAFLGFLYAIYVLWCYLTGFPAAGWSSLMVAILVVGGVQMMMLGVLGEYLWRTFDESRQRPRYIIEYKID